MARKNKPNKPSDAEPDDLDLSRAEGEGMPPPLPMAERFTIRTPQMFSGYSAGVWFDRGVGQTDDAAQAAFCRSLGYEVTP